MSDLFWSKVARGDESECWEWQACRNEKGYGVFGANRKTRKAHRVAYELLIGPIPSGLCLLHTCDNPACCNPAHLKPGTRADNNRDMHKKGRHNPGTTKTPVEECRYKRGTSHHNTILNVDTVRAIRAEYSAGGTSLSKLAKKYGRGLRTIHKVVRRETWKHVA